MGGEGWGPVDAARDVFPTAVQLFHDIRGGGDGGRPRIPFPDSNRTLPLTSVAGEGARREEIKTPYRSPAPLVTDT